jgi:hypothetical protein
MQRLLLLHTVSMMVLGGVEATGKLEDLLDEVVTRCFSSLFGSGAAKAMNSYLDPRLAAKDPAEYASKLRRLTGEKSSNIMLRRIEDLLCEKTGEQKREWKSFAECVEAVRSKFPV